ncbi:MAG: NAD(P)H-dependent glycerol-3-phosphate dehydrogenase [Gammaproteobacteria bacterium]|nr:NAD(P)H-dependent glycerol-3-phosphate dehydrogenase [Gammaproteobacteria bacterium]
MSTRSDTPAITILGAGSWGTALALLIARNGCTARLWTIDPAHAAAMHDSRENQRYLPDISFPADLHVYSDMARAIAGTSGLLVVVPSHAFRATLERVAPLYTGDQALLAWGTKGFDDKRAVLLSEVAAELMPNAVRAVVSGPSFAGEVALGLPTALTVAADTTDAAERVAGWLRGGQVRVYTNDDIAGVQLGGAIKNVMALAAGISDGLGFGANARAALITRGLAEMNRLGVALGGKPQTFMGLTGVGDLVLTCTDNQSRNRRAGIGLGQGKALETVMAEIGQAVEGIKTVHELYAMARRLNVDMPITEQVYRVVYEGLPPARAVELLLSRDPKPE